MPQTITNTAELQCSKGTVSSALTVSSQDFCFIDGKKLATEADKQTGVNIKPFGECKLKPKKGGYLPCTPASTAWLNTAVKDEVNGNKLLLDTSTCPCSTGGTISVKDKGHKENHNSE